MSPSELAGARVCFGEKERERKRKRKEKRKEEAYLVTLLRQAAKLAGQFIFARPEQTDAAGAERRVS